VAQSQSRAQTFARRFSADRKRLNRFSRAARILSPIKPQYKRKK
jgi:hypothetical protein